MLFTIQNVPIKLKDVNAMGRLILDLQYKMFLLKSSNLTLSTY